MKLLHKYPDVYYVKDDFPDLNNDERFDELICISKKLSPNMILKAYKKGMFPWFKKDEMFFWFSPDPRMVIDKQHFKVSKSLRKILHKNPFEIRFNTDFESVIRLCANIKRTQETWITHEFIDAYTSLAKQNGAMSVESYQDGKLVGGFYGLFVGNIFVGESMFHKVSNASKVAFSVFANKLFSIDPNALIDTQVPSPHFEAMGAIEIPRKAYIARLLTTPNEDFGKKFQ